MLREISRVFTKRYFNAVILLVRVAIKRQNMNTFLGSIWTFLQPCINIAVMSLAFSIILRIPNKDYPLYIASSFMPWALLVGCITSGSNSLIAKESIFKRCMLSKTMFVFADSLMAIYNFLISLTCIYIFISLLIFKAPHASMLFFPIAILPLLICCFSGALMFSYIAPYVRDMNNLLAVFFQSMFWLVPIAYPIENISPEKQIFFKYNPFYLLLNPIQSVVYYGRLPDSFMFSLACLIALFAVVISLFVYKKLRRQVIFYL